MYVLGTEILEMLISMLVLVRDLSITHEGAEVSSSLTLDACCLEVLALCPTHTAAA